MKHCKTKSRFIDNGDGTVTDNYTGLMWQQETASGTYNWQNALRYCENLELAGHKDWRLPNVKELQSIIDYGRYRPSINPVFNAKSARYWSSITDEDNTHGAWSVFFWRGDVGHHYKTAEHYVRAVRGRP